MTDPLVQQLTRELGLRATDMDADPTIAALVVQRGHAVRRRRALVAGVASAAAVATAAVAAFAVGPGLPLGGRSSSPPANRSTSSVDQDAPAPSSGPPTVGYVINGGSDPDHLRERSVVHLGGRSVTLPAGWSVRRMTASGSGYLLYAQLPDGNARAVYIGPDGDLKQLPHLAPGAMPANRAGTEVVDTLQVEIAGELQFVDLPSGAVADRATGLPSGQAIPLGVVGPHSLLVSQDDGKQLVVWTSPTPGQPAVGTPLVGASPLTSVTDTDVSGLVLSLGDAGIRLQSVNDQRGWTYAASDPARFGLPPQFSPDGSTVGAITDGHLVLISTDRGVARRSDLLRTSATYSGLYWEGTANVLVAVSESETGPGVSLIRCSTRSLRCTPTGTSGYLVLPSS